MVLEEHALGVSWTQAELMERSSHALVDDGRVWLVDPVDGPEARAAWEACGSVVAVLQLLDRHPRDCAALADEYGVPHLRLPKALPGTPFEVVGVLDLPGWREVALWWPAQRALVIAEVVGSGSAFAVGDGPLGVHPMLRLPVPARALAAYEPEWVLVGHGPPVHGPGTAAALRDAFGHARSDVIKLLRRLPRLLRG